MRTSANGSITGTDSSTKGAVRLAFERKYCFAHGAWNSQTNCFINAWLNAFNHLCPNHCSLTYGNILEPVGAMTLDELSGGHFSFWGHRYSLKSRTARSKSEFMAIVGDILQSGTPVLPKHTGGGVIVGLDVQNEELLFWSMYAEATEPRAVAVGFDQEAGQRKVYYPEVKKGFDDPNKDLEQCIERYRSEAGSVRNGDGVREWAEALGEGRLDAEGVELLQKWTRHNYGRRLYNAEYLQKVARHAKQHGDDYGEVARLCMLSAFNFRKWREALELSALRPRAVPLGERYLEQILEYEKRIAGIVDRVDPQGAMLPLECAEKRQTQYFGHVATSNWSNPFDGPWLQIDMAKTRNRILPLIEQGQSLVDPGIDDQGRSLAIEDAEKMVAKENALYPDFAFSYGRGFIDVLVPDSNELAFDRHNTWGSLWLVGTSGAGDATVELTFLCDGGEVHSGIGFSDWFTVKNSFKEMTYHRIPKERFGFSRDLRIWVQRVSTPVAPLKGVRLGTSPTVKIFAITLTK